jgi:hypothetical protein
MLPPMSYTLIGSARSPYVRICRMLLIQNNIDFNFRLLNFVDDPKDAATLAMESPGFYFSRQRARIPANLQYLAPWVSELDPSRPGDWNYPAMSLFSFLFWAEARDLLKISDYPEHAAFQARFENACAVAATGFKASGR